MCLGLPAQVVEAREGDDLIDVDMAGVVRKVNSALLDGPWDAGEWVLIHSGFVLERMSDEEAQDALALMNAFAAELDST